MRRSLGLRIYDETRSARRTVPVRTCDSNSGRTLPTPELPAPELRAPEAPDADRVDTPGEACIWHRAEMMGILPSYSAASSSHTEYFRSRQRRSAPVRREDATEAAACGALAAWPEAASRGMRGRSSFWRLGRELELEPEVGDLRSTLGRRSEGSIWPQQSPA